MKDHKVSTTYIPHLKTQFSRATPVLFTGAGFSMDVKNKVGTTIPSSEVLCDEMFQILYPDDHYDGEDTLMDLFDAARQHHRKKLVERMNALLTVDPTSLPEYYRTIFSMPWSRVYTLNLDDLELAVSVAFNLPRKIYTDSATNPTSKRDIIDDGLEVLHLNGCLTDLPDNVTFATSQYVHRIKSVDTFYERFVADFMTRPIIFIGTKLDEAPLWQHLKLRHDKGGNQLRELRPRSYLVTPRLTRSRESLLSTYNTVWLKMTAEEFVSQILAHLQSAKQSGLMHLKELATSASRRSRSISIVDTLLSDPLKQTEYLIGQEPDWSDIQSGRAISRQVDDEIVGTVSRLLSNDGLRGILILTGTAGSGKSSSLMRIALSLTAQGMKIGWIDAQNYLSCRDILSGMQLDSSPTILAIDESAMYGNELSTLMSEVAKLESRPLVIVEVRSGSKERVINVAKLSDVPVEEITMPYLEDQDIERLIAALDRENRLGILKGQPHHARVTAFRERANRQLLVAMYEATTGKKFEVRIKEELNELKGVDQFIYGLLALATVHRFDLTTQDIVIAVGDKTNRTLNIVEKLLSDQLIVRSKSPGFVRTRHRVIARIIVDDLQQRGALFDILYGLNSIGLAIMGWGRRRHGRAYRLIKTFFNHDLLFRLLDAEQARKLYGLFEEALNWDYHYWLQRGSLEVEEGSLHLAENFLNQARSLVADDPYVNTEWAYLLFRKAITKSGATEAPALVEDATQILTGLIQHRRVEDEYPYHVLGTQGLSWARRGIRNETERAVYLGKLVLFVKEGISKFPYSNELKQIETALREESLKLAVPRRMRSDEVLRSNNG